MLHPAVLLLSCLLLRLGSSAPLFSDADSSSDEDLQLSAVFPVGGVASHQTPPTLSKASPGMMVEVKDTKTNMSLSFAIFIIPEEEKDGSGTDGGGRSDGSSSSSESDEETKKQELQPVTSLLPAETDSSSQPMVEELSNHMTDEENLSSEEILGDQSMFVSSDEEADHVSNTVHLHISLSDDTDDFNNRTEGSEVNTQPAVTAANYPDDKNNTRSDDLTYRADRTEAADPTSTLTDDSDDFNNNDPNDPKLSLSYDLGNSLSAAVTELSLNLQGIAWSPGNPRDSSSQRMDHVLQEVLSSSSEKSSLTKDQDRVSSSSQTSFSLSSDESDESSETFSQVTFDQKNQTGVSSGPGSDESLEDTSYRVQQGTTSRDGTQVTGPTTRLDLISSDPDRKEVQDTSALSIQTRDTAGFILDQDGQSTILSMQKNAMSQINSEESVTSISQVNFSSNPDSSEESQESAGAQEVIGLMAFGRGHSRFSSSEVNSSSEEVMLTLPPSSSSSPLLVSSPVPSTQTPTEAVSFSSESQESDSPGLDSESNSQKTNLNPNAIPKSDSNLSPGSNYNPSFDMNFSSSSEISRGQSEELSNTKVPADANPDAIREANPTVDYGTLTASIAASSEANIMKLENGVKEAEAYSTDSSHNVSTDAEPTTATVCSTSLPRVHASSGLSTHANTDICSELSVEEADASTEATAESAVSMKPTITTEYSRNPPDSRAHTDALTNVKGEPAGADVSTEANSGANRPGPDQYASSEENVASPVPPPAPRPHRKRPYRFGFLGPISHSYDTQASSHAAARETLAVHRDVYANPLHSLFNSHHNTDRERRQQTVSRQSSRKHMEVSTAKVANPTQSSSEETTS